MGFPAAQLSLWPEAKVNQTDVAGHPHLIIRTCAHMLESGRLCRQPAVGGRRHCRHHIVLQIRRHRMARARRRLGRLRLPSFLDQQGVQIGLARLRSAFAAGYIEPERARTLAYVLRMVASLDRQARAEYEAGAARGSAAVPAKSNGHYEVAVSPVSSRGYIVNGM